MKRRLYSQPLSVQWAEYHKLSKKTRETPQQYFEKKNSVLLTNSSLIPHKRQIEAFVLDLWAADVNESFLHLYFVDQALRRFLEGIPLPDLNEIADFIKEWGFSLDDQALLPNGRRLKISEKKVAAFPFGIHVPGEKKERGAAFNFILNEESELLLVWAVGIDQGWVPLKKFDDLLRDATERMKGVKEIVQLAVNTVAYMNVFPNCVVDGVPDEVKASSKKLQNSLTIGIADKVIESTGSAVAGSTVSPHFRRGHFRKLTAERYTKMRGKLIFVHQTMVNGSAKTVYTADSIQDMLEEEST